jgi:integrase
MPKKRPEPFWREQTQCFYVQIGNKQHRLSPDEAEAWRLYHELMARPPEAAELRPGGAPQFVVEVIDAFLEWAQKNREQTTYAWYKERLQIFTDSIPARLTVSELRPYHITREMDRHAWTNNGKHNFARAVQRAFNWSEKQGLIDRSPVRHVEKPAMEARELAIRPADYAQVMKAVTEPHFRDLIELAWETGARPEELRKIEAAFFDEAMHRIVFPVKESKGKKNSRVIYLGTDRAREIVARQAKKHPAGPILRNSAGNPWRADSINCAFERLKKKIGRKVHLGAFRKGFTTEALKNGVDTVTTAHLLGHSNAVMVSRVYGKVQQDPAFMAEAARRAKGFKAGEDA